MSFGSVSKGLGLGVFLPAMWLAAGACTAGGNADDKGLGADGAGGPGVSPSGTPVFGDNGPNFGGAADSVGCSQLEIGFEALTPTVLIVVDRSSSQWDNYPNDTWDPMKQGILKVVKDVQAQIRIGMVTYTGQNGGTCPDLYPPMNQVTFDKNNYDVIATALDSVNKPSYKGETPTAATIQQALPVLLADPGAGDKVILLVTDGDPDFCNDPDRVCSMDAVIGAVQSAYSQGVLTTVFGLKRADLSEQHLRDVANAGTGQPVAWPNGVNSTQAIQNRCQNNPPGMVSGTYAAQGGTATYYQANGTDTAALGQALNDVIYGIRSCVFDVNGAAEIDAAQAGAARITIDGGAPLVFGDANGWRLRSGTEVELLGSACQQIKNPATRDLKFDFPCETLLPR